MSLCAQKLFSGTIIDEKGLAIPSAKVYVKNDAELRTVVDLDGYFEMRLLPGEYYLIVSSLGYDDREVYLGMTDEPTQKEIQLFPANIKDLEMVEITTKKTNPGRDIMLEVVKRRDQINPWNYPHTVEVYTRATEKLTEKEKTEKQLEREEEREEKEKKKEEKEKKEKKAEEGEV